jgi:hypothetical protein
MRQYIKKLQSKPEVVRKQIMFGFIAVSMSIVVLIFISTIGHRFGPQNIAKVQDDIKPFALFGQAVSNTYNNISASVGNIKSIDNQSEEQKNKTDEKQIDLIPVQD